MSHFLYYLSWATLVLSVVTGAAVMEIEPPAGVATITGGYTVIKRMQNPPMKSIQDRILPEIDGDSRVP